MNDIEHKIDELKVVKHTLTETYNKLDYLQEELIIFALTRECPKELYDLLSNNVEYIKKFLIQYGKFNMAHHLTNIDSIVIVEDYVEINHEYSSHYIPHGYNAVRVPLDVWYNPSQLLDDEEREGISKQDEIDNLLLQRQQIQAKLDELTK